MIKGFIVTGTDTDVGKTVTTATLTRWLRSRGVDIVPMKPVQTGATRRADGWHAPDLDFTLNAIGLMPPAADLALMQPFCYGPACSPHLAVGEGETPPSVDAIVAAAEALAARHDAVVVEGAGGLMVPLNATELMADLFAALDMPVILVGRVGLGSINHVLLSVSELERRGLPVAGVVLNETKPQSPEDAFIRADNPRSIARFGGVRCLGTLPYSTDLSAAGLGRAAAALSGLEDAFAPLLAD